MKRLLVVLFVLLVCIGSTMAQTPITISLGPTAGISLPMGDLSNTNGLGFFGGARAKFIGLVAPVDFAASFTYNSWGGKDLGSGVKTDATNAVIVSAGAQYPIPMEGAKPYILADLMYTSLTVNVALPYGGTTSATGSKIGFAFGGGVAFGDIDASVKYQLMDSGVSALGVGATYYFSLQ